MHKMANVLDKLPKGSQPKAKGMLHEIYLAETKEAAEKAFDLFVSDVRGEVPEGDGVPGEGSRCVAGVLRLPGGALGAHPDDEPDRERVRDGAAEARQDEGEREPGGVPGDGLQADGESASKGWRSLNGSPLLAEVIKGTIFIDGIKEKPAA